MASLEEKRARIFAAVPAWYSGWGHFALINASTLAVITLAAWFVVAPTWEELALVPAALVFANAFEWWIHKGPLHHPWPLLGILYARHAKSHHVAFTHDRMAIRSSKELMLVLFPPYVLPLLMILTAPVSVGLYLARPNLGLLFLISALLYYLLYEWLHTLHHLPKASWLGSRRSVAWLRRPHQLHHDPKLMTRGNFNVSFPLTDWVLRSTLPVHALGTPETDRSVLQDPGNPA